MSDMTLLVARMPDNGAPPEILAEVREPRLVNEAAQHALLLNRMAGADIELRVRYASDRLRSLRCQTRRLREALGQ